MIDTTIFGIDSNVIIAIAEIAVAGTTVILAYFTYQSVKISRITLSSLKDEIDLAKKDFENKQIDLEKPQVLDQLKEVINPLSEKIIQELNQIDERTFLWKSEAYSGDLLFYKADSSTDFYTDTDFNTPLGTIIYDINTSFPVFRELCEKRYKIYFSISDLFAKIKNACKTPNIDKKIGELILEKNPPRKVYSDDVEYNYDVVSVSDFIDFDTPPLTDEIPLDDFKEAIIDLGIADLLNQRTIPRTNHEKMIFSEYSRYKKDMNTLFETKSFVEHSESFRSLIEELKDTDTQLKSEMKNIKSQYREKYHLNDKEYWAIFKNTS